MKLWIVRGCLRLALMSQQEAGSRKLESRGSREAGIWKLDAEAERWVPSTLEKMSVEEKVGQLSSRHSDRVHEHGLGRVRALVKAVHEQRVGGFHVFGGTEKCRRSCSTRPTARSRWAAARGRLDHQPVAGDLAVRCSTPRISKPASVSASRVRPPFRGMAFGAAGDERLAEEAGRVTGEEARALGVHVNFAPVVDVNNNPRNPVINTRSYGEDPSSSDVLPAPTSVDCRPAGMSRR